MPILGPCTKPKTHVICKQYRVKRQLINQKSQFRPFSYQKQLHQDPKQVLLKKKKKAIPFSKTTDVLRITIGQTRVSVNSEKAKRVRP